MFATSLQSSHDCSCKSSRERSFMRTKSFSNGIFAPVTTPVSCTKRARRGKCPDPLNATGSPLKSEQKTLRDLLHSAQNRGKSKGFLPVKCLEITLNETQELAQSPLFCAKSWQKQEVLPQMPRKSLKCSVKNRALYFHMRLNASEIRDLIENAAANFAFN